MHVHHAFRIQGPLFLRQRTLEAGGATLSWGCGGAGRCTFSALSAGPCWSEGRLGVEMVGHGGGVRGDRAAAHAWYRQKYLRQHRAVHRAPLHHLQAHVLGPVPQAQGEDVREVRHEVHPQDVLLSAANLLAVHAQRSAETCPEDFPAARLLLRTGGLVAGHGVHQHGRERLALAAARATKTRRHLRALPPLVKGLGCGGGCAQTLQLLPRAALLAAFLRRTLALALQLVQLLL
mmetsp:Transcript_5050/g.9586  ORF Transcript_5050/g.9586 Transcript_5050/m.9586 type:complete len:234 (+) Transcript_5050:2993-3694(+)